MAEDDRLPGFVIIGTMKSGSTTLYRWLEAHPDVWLPSVKEPNFFSDDRFYRRGTRAYAALFADCPDQKLTGEASVKYTDPRFSETAATRARETVPSARLVCLLRDPVERMRSHYRHEVQRGRERRPFVDAVTDPANPYVRRSSYALALEPWVRRFPATRLHVLSFEELVSSVAAWHGLLDFLKLDPAPWPDTVHNVTADKAAFSPVMRRLWDAGIVQRLPRAPSPLRRVARRVLLRPAGANAALVESARERVPDSVIGELESQVVQLKALVQGLDPDWKIQP